MSVKTPSPEKMFWTDLYQFSILNRLLFTFYFFFFNLAAILVM